VLAAFTALATTISWWALYNGLISYLVIFILLVGEWLFRQWYKQRHPNLES